MLVANKELKRQLHEQDRYIKDLEKVASANNTHNSSTSQAGDQSVKILETGLEIAERLQQANEKLRSENEMLQNHVVDHKKTVEKLHAELQQKKNNLIKAATMKSPTGPSNELLMIEVKHLKEKVEVMQTERQEHVTRERTLEAKLSHEKAQSKSYYAKVELLSQQLTATRREFKDCQAKLLDFEKQVHSFCKQILYI